MSVLIYGENIRYVTDGQLERALDDIKFELAEREMKKIREEENE